MFEEKSLILILLNMLVGKIPSTGLKFIRYYLEGG